MGSLYTVVSPPDSMVYSISNVGKEDRFLILIGHVIYVYWVLFRQYLLYKYYVQSGGSPLACLTWYIVLILSMYLTCIRTEWPPLASALSCISLRQPYKCIKLSKYKYFIQLEKCITTLGPSGADCFQYSAQAWRAAVRVRDLHLRDWGCLTRFRAQRGIWIH